MNEHRMIGDRVKHAIRKSLRKVREKLPLTFQRDCALKICEEIKKTPEYQHASHIALYYPIAGEVDVLSISEDMSSKKQYYFPKITSENTLVFLPKNEHTLFQSNTFGIPEPIQALDTALPAHALELVIVPLVSFDEALTRLGTGGGYYDRTFEGSKKTIFLGVAYDFQKTSWLEPAPWDIPMDLILTEKRIYRKINSGA